MNPLREAKLIETRRHFFGRAAAGIGTAALSSLLNPELFSATSDSQGVVGGMPDLPHFAPKAKRVIYLFMSGAPSQLDMWDYKPKMNDWFDKDLPDSVRNGQRITTMTSGQKRFPIAPSTFKFKRRKRFYCFFRVYNVISSKNCVHSTYFWCPCRRIVST